MQRLRQEPVDYASKMKGQGGFVGLGARSDEIKVVCHDPVIIHEALHSRPGSLHRVFGRLYH